MANNNLVPATIKNLNTGATVNCMFRPKEYSFTKQNSWGKGKVVGKTMQPPQFQGGQPMTLKMDLVFDTYEDPAGSRDVRQLTDGLWIMMKIDPSKQETNTKKSE